MNDHIGDKEVNDKLCVRLISAMTLSNDCNLHDTL